LSSDIHHGVSVESTAPATQYDYDAAVIGGGPGGAATAIGLRRAGRSVIVLEAAEFPRFHIGESMLPMSNHVFRELGIYEAVAAANFQVKRGATFVDETGESVVSYDFNELTDLASVPTFGAQRSEFDELLLEEARRAGAMVVHGRATEFDQDAEGASLQYSDADGERHRVRVGAVVDASGRAGFLARRLGLRAQDSALQKAAIYGHFRGIPRLPGNRAGDIRIISISNLGWIWIIPLAGDATSVGIVLDLEDFKRLPAGSPTEKFHGYVESIPAARDLLAGAVPTSEVEVESSFSYSATRYAGDRWLLVGDAGSFLDPVFSSGVLLALLGGTEAARAIEKGLRGGRLDARELARFDRESARRYRFLRRFILAFYRDGMRDLFFAPRPVFGVLRTITTLLAGGWDPGFIDRRRIDMFYGLARLQRYVPVVPRLHAHQRPLP
jgi:flavin-dependent dehydrogenase